jgi:DNA-binding GntR family transcriptional regulator
MPDVEIISGKPRPNEPLIEDDPAVMFAVSLTPIRESLQRLARDGLVAPRKRGWQVREFTHAEVRENYEIRADLEGLSARFASVCGSPTHKAKIQSIHESV